MRRLTILYFIHSRERGGAEQHLLSLVHGLDCEAFQPIVACPLALAAQIRPDLKSGVEVLPIKFRSIFDLGAALRLIRILRQREIDILHSHLFCSSLRASPFGRLAGVPAILETPHVNEQWRRGPLKARFFADRLIGRCVDAYIAVSQANARYLIEKKRLPGRKIRIIPNGIALDRFPAAGRPPVELRRSLGIDPDVPVLISIARLEPQKGHSVLLRAMARVRAELPRARLLILGEGSLRVRLERESQSLGLAEAVRFVGRQSNVPDWLALSQVVVLASFYEGLPLVALEALAAGKPLVATAVDGTPEVVRDNITGLTVPPGDPASLAAAILQMLRNPARARTLAAAGRQLVAEQFTIGRQVRDTENLYREIWEKRASRLTFARSGRFLARVGRSQAL